MKTMFIVSVVKMWLSVLHLMSIYFRGHQDCFLLVHFNGKMNTLSEHFSSGGEAYYLKIKT